MKICHAWNGDSFMSEGDPFPCGARWESSTNANPTGGNAVSANLAFVNCEPCREWLIAHGGVHIEPSGRARLIP